MDQSNYIALGAAVISGISLLVSLLAVRQRKFEMDRTLRSQLTDIIVTLDSIVAESDDSTPGSTQQRDESRSRQKSVFRNSRLRFLARQAIIIMDRIDHLVTDSELNRVADAFRISGHFEEARQFYEKALYKANQLGLPYYYKVYIARQQARNFFKEREAGSFDNGRKQYHTALKLIKGNSDFAKTLEAETYERWASDELEAGQVDRAEEKIGPARKTAEEITNPSRRLGWLKHLNDLEARIKAHSIPRH